MKLEGTWMIRDVKGLLQASVIYGPPALCFAWALSTLGFLSWFKGPANAHLHRLWMYQVRSSDVGLLIQEFLRCLLYSQVIRGIAWRSPLAMMIFGWWVFTQRLMDAVYTFGPPAAYVWFILYWSIILFQAYLVFKAEKQK